MIGTNNERIEHISCELAWFIWHYYTSSQRNETLVGYSMGGLIARRAMACTANPGYTPCLRKDNSNPFPLHSLLVRDAVDMDTPNGGFDNWGYWRKIVCGGIKPHDCIEGLEMFPGSPFISDLAQYAQNPQGTQGTKWTLLGSDCGNNCVDMAHSSSPQGGICADIDSQSAVNMDGAFKIVYEVPCYDHQGVPHPLNPNMLNDPADTLDATVLYCSACNYPGNTSNASLMLSWMCCML